MAEHNELGNKGEDLAAAFLEKKGYDITERNWRYNQKEIDIIAWHENRLIVVEVRTRTSDGWENPKETITAGKIRYIVEATEAYIEEKDIAEEVRFDVITLIPDKDNWIIEHLEEAFHPTL